MGFRMTWIAAQEAELTSLCQFFGLQDTGDRTEHATDYLFEGIELPSGWALIIVNEYYSSLLGNDSVKRLSEQYNTIVCMFEESLMTSEASEWSKGEALWTISHDSQQGLYHLTVEGTPPMSLKDIEQTLVLAQDAEGGENSDVDLIIDIPIEVAWSKTGFRHRETPDLQAIGFQVLKKSKNG